jgi:hypothetical protein
VGCFAVIAVIILVPNPFFSFAPPEYSGTNNSFVTQWRSNTGLILSGFQLPINVYTPSDDFDITLFWQTQRFLSENYQARLFLKNNSDDSIWNVTDLRHPGYYPTRRWNTRQYVADRYSFPLAQSIPSGNYQIHVEVYNCVVDCSSNARLDFFNYNGQFLGADVTLPTLISIRP